MKKYGTKKVLAILTMTIMIMEMLPFAVYAENESSIPETENAITEIKYLDENGNVQGITDYQLITTDNFSFHAAEDTWLVFDKECTKIPKVVLDGGITYHLILKDDMDVTVDYSIQLNGEWTNLVIYSQPEKTGTISLGDSMTYGCLDAAIGPKENSDCGTITINGGIINAKATRGAAIGTGASDSVFSTSKCKGITINGGTINAESGEGAAIGCGEWDTMLWNGITINGGTIFAKSTNGAGIGAGSVSREDLRNSAGNIYINGGIITAESQSGAGIGSGDVNGPEAFSRVSSINVSGGEIKASSHYGSGIGIGSGSGSECRSVKLMGYDTVKAYSYWMDAISRECEGSKILTVNPMYVIKAGESEDSLEVINDIYEAGNGYVELIVYNQGADDVTPASSTVPPEEEIPENPKTGDKENGAVYALLMILAAAIFGIEIAAVKKGKTR